jgi:hypothetical protein
VLYQAYGSNYISVALMVRLPKFALSMCIKWMIFCHSVFSCYFYQARVSSSENKTQLDCRITKGAVKPPEKPKLSLHKKITGKTDNSHVSSKRTPKTRNINSNYGSSHRQHTEVRSSTSVLHNSLARDRSVTSPISKADQVKANSASKGLLDYLPTTLPLHARTYQVDILAIFILELQLATVLMVSPTGHLFMQSTIKETAVTGGLRKKALDDRRSGLTYKNTYTSISLPASLSLSLSLSLSPKPSSQI